jgi:hypothetical protein
MGRDRAGWPVRMPIQHTPDAVEFEDLMHATGREFAFVDLRRPAAGGAWLQQPMWARPVENSPQRATWPDAMDGLFYMREMKPLTRVSQ